MNEDAKEIEFEITKRDEVREVRPMDLGGYIGALTPEAVAHAEAAVAMVPKIKAIALRVTNHADWHKFGDKAYLNESGSKKLAALWGVSLSNGRIEEIRTKDEAGNPMIKYSARVTASLRGRSVEEMGESDTKDDFFRFRWKDGDRVEIPFDELDLTSIKKKSYTNALGRAVKALLGYGNVLWSEVVGNVKDSGQSAQVDFKKASPAKAQTVASAEGKDMRTDLWLKLLDLANEDPVKAAEILEKETSFVKDGKEVKGFRDPQNPKISDKWIYAAYGKIKKLWEPTFGGPPEEREPGQEG